jgi:hypothetical protein
MHDLLAAAIALGANRDLARSSLPDAPVVAVKQRGTKRFRFSVAGVLVRRTVASTNREEPYGT